MRLKKVLSGILAVSLLLSAAAVFGGGSGEQAQTKKTWRIAFIPQLIGIPYFTAMEKGGNDAAKAFGVTYMNVGSPTASAAEQVRLMENLIQQKVDAISISVLDSASLNPVMERAEKAGIKVYTSDSDSPTSVRRVYVAQSMDKDLGYTLIDRLALQIGKAGKIGIVSGESTATNLNTWINFMKERVQAAYPDIQIVDIRYHRREQRRCAAPGRGSHDHTGHQGAGGGCLHHRAGSREGRRECGQQGEGGGHRLWLSQHGPSLHQERHHEGIHPLGSAGPWLSQRVGGDPAPRGKDFQESTMVPGMKDPVKYFADSKVLLLGPPLVIDAGNVDSFDF